MAFEGGHLIPQRLVPIHVGLLLEQRADADDTVRTLAALQLQLADPLVKRVPLSRRPLVQVGGEPGEKRGGERGRRVAHPPHVIMFSPRARDLDHVDPEAAVEQSPVELCERRRRD